MSSTTTELKLFKYNTATDGKEVFSIDTAMNANWDKIDAFATAIKDLSNLSTKGEKRFSDLSTAIGQKLSAEVSLAENGYIKFNNHIIIQFGRCHTGSSDKVVAQSFPITFTQIFALIQSVGRNSTDAFGGFRNAYNVTNSSFTYKNASYSNLYGAFIAVGC